MPLLYAPYLYKEQSWGAEYQYNIGPFHSRRFTVFNPHAFKDGMKGAKDRSSR